MLRSLMFESEPQGAIEVCLQRQGDFLAILEIHTILLVELRSGLERVRVHTSNNRWEMDAM